MHLLQIEILAKTEAIYDEFQCPELQPVEK